MIDLSILSLGIAIIAVWYFLSFYFEKHPLEILVYVWVIPVVAMGIYSIGYFAINIINFVTTLF